MTTASDLNLSGAREFMRRFLAFGPLTGGVLVASTAALLYSNWLLLRRNSQLDTALQTRASALAPQTGKLVPAIYGIGLDGEQVQVVHSVDARQTVLFVFSTKCQLCDVNWPYWEAIARQLDRDRYRAVYANTSNDMTDAYTDTHYFHPDGVLLARTDPRSIVEYSLSLTPMILLISSTGTIANVWLGVTREKDRSEIERVLHVTLTDVLLPE